jgi:hypothetical protein
VVNAFYRKALIIKQSVMKKILYCIPLLLIIAAACQRDPVDNSPEPTLTQRVAGKWMLQKVNINYYQPITILDDSVRFTGGPADSLVFKPGGLMLSYDGTPGADTTSYSFPDNTHIIIDGERFDIRELTNTRFQLYADSVNLVFNERTVSNVFLVR